MLIARNSDSPRPAIGYGWWLIGLALGTMVLLWAGGDTVQVALRYDRERILQGEYWRLFTAHWVHADLPHMSLNALGSLVLSFLLARTYSIRQWLLILAASIVAIDVGFLCLTPHLGWYVGASGVLQGALAAGALMWWRTESRAMALALSAIVLGKLIWEQWHGALPLAGEMTVIVDAHLYGAIGGTVAAVGIELGKRISRSKQQQAPL